MRIGVDGTAVWGAKEGAPGGIVRYAVEITRNLMDVDRHNEYVVYCFNEVPSEFPRGHRGVEYRVHRPRNRKIWQQTVLPFLVLRDRLDVLFFPSNSAAAVSPAKTVATIHDLHPFVVSGAFDRVHSSGVHGSVWRSVLNRIYWRRMMKVMARKDRIIVPSQSTRSDLQRILGTPESKIAVVPEGVDASRFSVESDDPTPQAFRRTYGLPHRYLLCVGTHGYKNLPGSVRAFALVRRELEWDLKLVFAGSTRPLEDEVWRTIRQLGLEDDVLFTGFFPDEDLGYLYRSAELLLFPSHYEGFGLPVLEAFACGTPVVTSDRGSLPEVAGDAAVLVDASDPGKIAAAVLALLTDASFRESKRRQGLRRVQEFSWRRTAERTLEVLESLGGAT